MQMVVLLVGVTALVSGCVLIERFPGGGSLAEEDGNLVFAICQAIDADEVSFALRDLAKENRWVNFWEFENGGHFAEGTVLSTDPAITPPYPGERRSDVHPQPGTEIVVDVRSNDGTRVSPGFVVPAGGFIDGKWLQSDGTWSTDACP
ncbi:MAG TPA: hypothetical protein VGO65_06940 [Pseudolysinimonas sp.]|nr:hypothetical protein [Pseudolysinimonas sp.]